MKFEWNRAKAASNLRKHGVSFEEARTVFNDPLATTLYDPDHSVAEDRFLLIGTSIDNRLLIVSHTEQHDITRIISARIAKRSERRDYEEGRPE